MKKLLIILIALLLMTGCTRKDNTNTSDISVNSGSGNNNSDNNENNKKDDSNIGKKDEHVITPFTNAEDITAKIAGSYFMSEYELLSDKTDNYDYSSMLEIADNGHVEWTLAGMKGYIMEPELRIQIHKGDDLKEFGNDQWYFTLSGSMSQAGNEFKGTMVDDLIYMKIDVYRMNNMDAEIERSLIGTYRKEQPHTGSYQAPIYDAMVNMPQELINELDISSDLDVALIWANPETAVRSYYYEVETIDPKASETAYIVPIRNDTKITVYSGNYTGTKDNPAGFANVTKVYEVTLDAGQPLLLNVNLPEGMPSYYVEFNVEGDYAFWHISFPGYSNPFMLVAE